ncbi:MAG: antitoxin [Planctomycetes bacterium RIFCSPHIGHO2_12_39_6]|nr:MAG: antitoxin [Planctomycetes bacterium RIFCSPHIGHO2_12_39_6]
MFDNDLVLSILQQINEALEKIRNRSEQIHSADDFTDSPSGMEKLDSICMLFIAIGEALKNIDKITGGNLLSQYPETDWKGAIGFRDIIAHHYFDIDAEEVFWICTHELAPLSAVIKKIMTDLRKR